MTWIKVCTTFNENVSLYMYLCTFNECIIIYMYLCTGVKLLKEFKGQYLIMEQQRQELTNAEKLFDLPITMYPDMIEVDRELKNIGRVFEIYENQKVLQ